MRDDTKLSSANRLVITLLLVSGFVVILNETVMGVAVPHLMADLQISAGTAQWLTTAFLLTMAIVIPITGYLLQRFSTRSVFMLAMSSFSLGTLICALAPGFEVLVAGRVVQAMGTAIMLPLLMTTVMSLVPPASRGLVMGNISIVISVAPAIGPTVSGLILSALDWRWMFWLVLPIGIASLLLGMSRIRNVSEPKPTPLDIVSVVLSIFGFGGLVYGLSSLGEAANHPGPVPAWVPLVIGVVALILFVLRQTRLQRNDKALLDLRTLKSLNFTMSVVMLGVSMMALFGTIILLPLYTQTVLGLNVLQTGLMLLPGGLVMGLMAPLVGRLYDKHGPSPLIIPGSLIVTAALWSLTTLDAATNLALTIGVHVVLNIGLALIFTPLFSAGLGSLPSRLYSHGSAIISTIQQVAGAAGTALFIAVMTSQSAALTLAGEAIIPATLSGIRTAFYCGAAISALAVVASLFVRRPPENGDRPVGIH